MRINQIALLFIIFTTRIVFGQECKIQKNEFGDLIIEKNKTELNCFYRSTLQYNCDYTYFVNNNFIYFLGCSFIGLPSNGNMDIIYTYERFSIEKSISDFKIEFKKTVNKENYIKYIISEDGFLIKLKNDVVIEKTLVSEINEKNIFP